MCCMWNRSLDLVALPLLRSMRTKYRRGSDRRERKRERVVLADLILTTSPGRAFPWKCFAITLFIQVAAESREMCGESVHFATPRYERVKMTHRSDLNSHLSLRLHLSRSALNFQSAEVSDAPLAHGLSTRERLPPGTEASGWLVCLACSNNIHPARVQHTWMATTAQKVAGRTIVDATAHHCQVKGSRARRWRYTWAGLDSHDLSALNPRFMPRLKKTPHSALWTLHADLQGSQEMDQLPTEASVGGVTNMWLVVSHTCGPCLK